MLDNEVEDVKGKGKAKAKPARRTRRAYDSEDDSEHEELDDGMSDFIVEDDDDEDRPYRRRSKRQAGTKRARPIILDSEDEAEEEGLLFGTQKPVKVPTEQMKLMPRFLPSTKMKVSDR